MRRVIPGLLALVWAAAAAAANSLQFGPPAAWVKPTPLPAASAATQASVEILLLDRQLKLTPETVSYYVENAARIQTPQGLSELGTVTLAWNPDTDLLIVHKAHIIRDGKVIDMLGAGQTFTIARREVNLDYAALDGTLTAILQPAGLQVGDTLDIAYTLERTDPVLSGTSEAEVEVSPAVPISRLHVSARWPSSDPVRWHAAAGLPGVAQTHDGGTSGIRLDMTGIQPILQPRGAPFRFLIDRRIDFTSFGSWAEVAQRLAPLYERAARLSAGSPLQAEVARIRAGSPEPKERAVAALELVENQVRYVFLGMNDGGLVPAPAALTWSRRFGDCKGKTVLLLALLHGLGIEARPVAVSVLRGDGLDTRLPSLAFFDHVLVEAVIDGKTYWLDGTRMGDTSLDRLDVPYYHWGLPLVAGSAHWVAMVPPPRTEPMVATSIDIDATGGVADAVPLHVETLMRGEAGVVVGMRLDDLTPAQLDAGLREYWSRQYPDAKISAVSARYDAQAGAVRLTMDGTLTMQWTGGEHELGKLAVGYEANFERQPGPRQDAPFAVAYPTFTSVTERIKLPAAGKGFSVVGADVDQTVASVEFRRQADIGGGVFTGMASERSVATEFAASEAATDQALLRKLAHAEIDLMAPAGHVPTAGETGWGVPQAGSGAAGLVRSGEILFAHRELEAAIEDFDAALALDARNAGALAGRGIAEMWQGHDASARADVAAALAVEPGNPAALDGQGWLAFAAEDYAGAIPPLENALRANPKDTFAASYLALAHLRTGMPEEALAEFTEASRQKPDSVMLTLGLYWMRSVILGQEGKRAEAMDQARLLVAAYPKSPAAYFVAGAIYRAFHEPARAEDALNRGVALAPSVTEYLMRAEYRPWTDLAGRRSDIGAALKLQPRSAHALTMLAAVEMAAGQYGKAIASLSSAMTALDGNPTAVSRMRLLLLTLRGVAYEKAGQAALAAADLGKAREEANDPAALNELCWQLATANASLRSALADCDSAVAGEPRQPAFQDSRGFVLMRLGRYGDAIAAYDAALRLSPANPDSWYGRGICELRSGDARDGKADIETATALSFEVSDQFAHYGVRP